MGKAALSHASLSCSNSVDFLQNKVLENKIQGLVFRLIICLIFSFQLLILVSWTT